MRHLLLSDHWVLSDDALFRLCQSCPNLEQLGFACAVPPLASLRHILTLVPKLWAIRVLFRTIDKMDSAELDMHQFALATELWRPEYQNLKYFGIGENIVFKLGNVIYPSKPKNGAAAVPGPDNSLTARMLGPIRRLTRLTREDVRHVEIWGMDDIEFDPKFP
jgi:hypothetical protein